MDMRGKNLELGKRGETAAEAFLKKKGYRILEKNFRTPSGEIDIIAEHKKILVFVEVKTRAGVEFGHPLTAVTPAKQKQLGRMAELYLARHKITGRDCRFDVVSVIVDEMQDDLNVELFPGAFRV